MTLAKLRKEKHYTQQYIADNIGVKQSAVAMWETGKSVPSMKNLLALSKILEVSVDLVCDSLRRDEAVG